MPELNFATYVEALHPALMKHSEKQDAVIFLLNAVSKEKLGEEGVKGNDYILPDGSSLNRVMRGVSPMPENIRFATAKPETVESAAEYFRKEVAEDIHPQLKEEATERVLDLIRCDDTIPETKKESLLKLAQEEDDGRFLSETMIYAINRPIESITKIAIIKALIRCWFSSSAPVPDKADIHKD